MFTRLRSIVALCGLTIALAACGTPATVDDPAPVVLAAPTATLEPTVKLEPTAEPVPTVEPISEPTAAPAPLDAPAAAAGGPVQPEGGACPDDAPIKGNRDSMIYHVPGGRSYSRTKPEECFATAADAEAQGYRAAKR